MSLDRNLLPSVDVDFLDFLFYYVINIIERWDCQGVYYKISGVRVAATYIYYMNDIFLLKDSTKS